MVRNVPDRGLHEVEVRLGGRKVKGSKCYDGEETDGSTRTPCGSCTRVITKV